MDQAAGGASAYAARSRARLCAPPVVVSVRARELAEKFGPELMKRIRVLLIAPSLNIVGGQSIQADRLRRAFASHDEIDLSFYPIDPNLPSFLRRIPYVRTAMNAVVYYAGLIRAVASCDIVHAFTSSFWGYTLWIIPAIW